MWSNTSLLNIFLGGSQRTSTVKKNILGSILIKGISIAVSFFLVPLTLGFVDKELYGIWLTLSSIVIWLNFFDVGFTLGLKNKLAEAVALKDWEKGKKLVSTTYALMCIIFLPLMLLLFFVIPLINWCDFLNVQEKFRQDIIWTMYPLIACFCLQMILNIIISVVAAFQRTAFSTSFHVIAHLLSLIIIIFLPYVTKPSLFALSLAISTTPLLVLSIVSYYFYRHKFNKVSPSTHHVDFNYVKELFSLGGKFFIIQIQGIVLYQCTNILISNVSSPTDVSVYNIAYKYLSIGMMFYSICMGPLWPAFTDAYTKQDYHWMQRMYKKMCYLYSMVIIVFFVMTLISPIVYDLWVGNHIDIPFFMTLFIAIYMSVHSWDMLQITLVNGVGKIKMQTYVVLIGLFLHIPFSLFWGHYMSMGAIGVIISMLIISIIYSIVFTIQINLILRDKAFGIWNK